MKIYFSAALTQKKKLGKYYRFIVEYLEIQGHIVFQDTTTTSFSDAVNKTDYERFTYYKQVISWIRQADAVVLEVSFPSTLHIGHEVSLAIDQSKPVVALYLEDHEPSFFLGLDHPLVFWSPYHEECIASAIRRGLRFINEHSCVRYNLSLTMYQYRYVTKCAKMQGISKASFIRKLIDAKMHSR